MASQSPAESSWLDAKQYPSQIQHKYLVVITATVGIRTTVQTGDLGGDRSGTGTDARSGRWQMSVSGRQADNISRQVQKGEGCFHLLQAHNPAEYLGQEGLHQPTRREVDHLHTTSRPPWRGCIHHGADAAAFSSSPQSLHVLLLAICNRGMPSVQHVSSNQLPSLPVSTMMEP